MKPSQGGHPKTLIGIAFQHGGTFVILGDHVFQIFADPNFLVWLAYSSMRGRRPRPVPEFGLCRERRNPRRAR